LNGADNDVFYRKPLYKLEYNCIGESYPFGAAARCLPDDVVQRASAIMDQELPMDDSKEVPMDYSSASSTNTAYMRALTASLHLQIAAATENSERTAEMARDTFLLQQAMRSLAASYGDHLARLESRVEQFYQALGSQSSANGLERNSMKVLGETLTELRLVQSRIKSQEELLRERGLKRLPESYSLSIGETVVVADETSPWNGLTATIVSNDAITNGQQGTLTRHDVVVEFSGSAWDFAFAASNENVVVATTDASLLGPTVLQRYQLAIWDYVANQQEASNNLMQSMPDSKRKLNSLLSKLNAVSGPAPRARSSKKATGIGGPKATSAFSSSRERKAANRRK
jgi:hypothetical protein